MNPASLSTPRRLAAVMALGALMALAMPPVGAFPVLLLCVPGFILFSRAAPAPGKAFQTGWAFGAGYFIAGLYWISAALFVDIAQWGWVMPLSLVVGPSVFALWYGLVPLFAWRYRHDPIAHAVAFAAYWSIVEWLRGHLFTGFPWNLPGYAWMHVLPVMQVSAYVGIYGLTLLTLLWALLPVVWRNKALVGALTASFTVIAVLGLLRLSNNPTRDSGHTVRIVQANIPQDMKWSEGQEWRNLEKHMMLSESPEPFTFVVWPETSVYANLASNPDVAGVIASKMPAGSHAILGSLRVVEEERTFYNSVTVLDKQGSVRATYDKHHLVPFGEYIPFREKLNLTPIAAAIAGLGDFTAGKGPDTVRIGSLPAFSPLVCYEGIFPSAAAPRANRPDWLVNVTNDAWYGRTAGPYQHFEITRVRAIEEGLPLARAANTGISALIDPLGRIVAQRKLGETGTADGILPRPLPPTLYARLGDMGFLALFFLLAAVTEGVHQRRSSRPEKARG